MPRTPIKKSAATRNQLRIIAGQWRGRRLTFPDADGLRPTGDRIRETLFNWLAADIAASRCLDAFAGSGALGFEALSRGAREVVMVEQNPAVFRQLQASLAQLGSDRARLIRANALDWLADTAEAAFDIIFLDPPFAGNWLTPAAELIEHRELLAGGGLIYLESAATALPTLPAGWQPVRERRSGDTCYQLYRRQ